MINLKRSSDPDLERGVSAAADALIAMQRADGHWAFELEADATIPAEYLLLQHYLDEIDPDLEAAIARFLRAGQAEHGGWPLFYGGAFDLSASVKAYFALKAAGEQVKNKFYKNMSERAVQILKEDMEARGPVKLSEVEKTQQEILKVVRKQIEEGKIAIGGKGGTDVLV